MCIYVHICVYIKMYVCACVFVWFMWLVLISICILFNLTELHLIYVFRKTYGCFLCYEQVFMLRESGCVHAYVLVYNRYWNSPILRKPFLSFQRGTGTMASGTDMTMIPA